MTKPIPGVYPLDALDPATLVKGQWYTGFRCSSCQRVFAITVDNTKGRGEPQLIGDGRLNIICPFCSAKHLYALTAQTRYQQQ